MVEMKSGYKMTEVGVIPEDWEVKTLGKLACINGRIGFRGYTVKDLVRKGEGAIAIGGKHISKNYLDLSDAEYISWKKYYESPEIMVKQGDIVLAQRGTLGKSALIKSDIGPATINPSLVLINKIKCNNLYLIYNMQSSSVTDYILQINSQTSIPMISQKQIEGIKIAIAKLDCEQAAIATALSDVDSLISALTKKIEKKKAIKQGLMQQLLTGKKRLPGYEKNREPVQTEWGAIPKDWKTLSIGKCCSIKARIGWQGLKKSEYLSSGEYVLVTGTDFLNGRIDWKSCVYVSKKRYEQDANIQIVKHDILITKDGTIGKVAFLDDVPCLGTLNSGIFVVRSHSEELDQCYLSKIFESFIFDAFLESLVAGSTINHLYQKDFVHFNFPVPPTM
ncbi:MAG: restriction endonuclease subunit S [Eubacterium sp.]|nr:restriction endonuclease subunit S [Eubacterium sp.]